MSDNYLVMNEKIAYEYIRNTAANHTINGFYYQFLVTVSKWLDLYIEYKDRNEIYKLYCEFEDDIKIEEDNAIKYVQVKANKSPLTGSADSLKKTIYNFFLLYYCNKTIDKEVKFVLEGNGDIGKNSDLLKKWSSKNLSAEDRIKVIDLLKRIIVLKLKEKGKKSIVLNDINFNEFIDLISFNFKNQSVDECNFKEKNNILEKIKKSHIDIDAEILLPRLLKEVIDKSSNKDAHNRILNNERLIEILEDSENRIIEGEEKYRDMIKNIDDNTKVINNNVRHIKDNTDTIIEKIDNINPICEESKMLISDIRLNGKRIFIRSRSEIDESENQLDLSEFFVRGNPKKAYQNIINKDFWNKEIIYKINNFFDEIVKNKEKMKYILIDLDSTHTSIAFYIGYMYYKAFTRKIFMVRSEKLFISIGIQEKHNKFLDESIEVLQGEDTAVIINTTVSVTNSFNDIKKFIIGSKLPVKVISNYFTENIGKNSVTTENIARLASDIYLKLEEIKGTIHLFLICPNELAFAIGRELDKKSNIILYEYTNYCGDDEKESKKLYVETINTKVINF